MRSAATSPITIAGALVWPRISDGMTDASATRSPLHPADAQLGVDDGCGIRPHSRGSDRVVQRVRIAPEGELGPLGGGHVLAALGHTQPPVVTARSASVAIEALALRDARQQRRPVDAVRDR